MKLLDRAYKKKVYKLSGSCSRLYLIMRSKFFLSFSLFILIPFFIFGVAMLIKGANSLIDQNNKQITTGFNAYISNIESFENIVSKDEALITLFDKIADDKSTQSNNDKAKAEELLQETSKYIQNTKFNSIYILENNKLHTVYCKYNNPIPKNNILHKKWYTDAINNPDNVKFIGTSMQFFGNGKSEYVFSAAKALKDPQSGKVTGLLLVDFDYNTLNKIINASDYFKFSGRELYIINQDVSNSYDSPGNTIMYSNFTNLLTSPLDDEIVNAIGSSTSGTHWGGLEGKRNNIITFDTSSKIPWKVIYVLPYYKIIFGSIPFNSIWFILVLVCFIMILIFPFIIFQVLLKPINKLTSVITEYEKGSFPTRINLDIPNNEAELKNDNPNSLSNIDNLINKVYYNQLKQKEAELNSLQNKINPHFLYNTLESIRGAALYHGIDSIASMAKALSLLFRYSINNNVLVTIKEEIENLSNYITIQNFRHDDKFEVIYNIPEKVYEYKILKLILQPIVENSIKHGLEMKLGKGIIKVSFLDLDSIFKIEISDDGVGIPPEKILVLNKLLSEGNFANNNENSSPSGTGIGIQNVNSRIKLYFGNQYGIKFRETQFGTTVEIMLPVVE